MAKRKELDFVHLHSHGEYSVKDGVGTVEEYINLATEYGMKHFTMTDHGSIACWIRQYFHCQEKNINCIFGMEPYICPDRDKNLARIKEINEVELKDKQVMKDKQKMESLRGERKRISKYNHLILLAKNETGKKNIIYLNNDAQKNGFYFVPRLSYDILAEHSKGLIITSACMGSDISQALIKDDLKKAEELVDFYKSLIGDDFYIEMQLHDTTGQDILNQKLMKLAKSTKTKMIITNDSHYPLEKDSVVQDTLLLMQNGNKWDDVDKSKGRTENDVDEDTKKVWLFESKQLWYKTESELYKEWELRHKQYMPYNIYEEAILNTTEIAEKCEKSISFGEEKGNYIPQVYGTEDEARKLLMNYCNEGYMKRQLYLKPNRKEYIDRLHHEIYNIITPTECANYLLIVRQYVTDCKKNYGVESVGPGRGSGAGMLVNYCTDITDVDPIKWGLVAERFMNPERKDMADIDVDFSPDIRPQVKKDIKTTFKLDYTADISTWGTMGTRSCLSDVAKAFGVDYKETKKVTSVLESDADDMSLEELIKTYPKFAAFHSKYGNPKNENYKENMFYCFEKLRGQIKNLGKHAAGVVVTKNPIMYDVALVKTEDKETKEIYYVSAWVEGASRSELGRIGRPKFDILGLITLKEQKEINDLIEERYGKRIDYNNIPDDDKKAYKLCRSGENDGVFQLHSQQMCDLCKTSKVKNTAGVSAISAVGRPATLRAGVANEYCIRANGTKNYYIDPRLEGVLGETFGVIVYQEQTMFLPVTMANFTMTEADKMRKFLSKIKEDKVEEYAEKIKELETKFKKNAIANGFDRDYVDKTWEQIWEFRTYGFNKSHAVSYGILTNRDLWFKANYMIEFWTAKLNNTSPVFESSKGEESKTERFCNTISKKYGISILPPRLNHSTPKFSIEKINNEEYIRYGLWFVKGVKNNSSKINYDYEYPTFKSFLKYNDGLGKTCMEGLINVGYFDEVFENRRQLSLAFEEYHKNVKKGNLVDYIKQFKDEDNFSPIELCDLEKQYLGFYLSEHPTKTYADKYDDLGIYTIEEAQEEVMVNTAGILTKVKVIKDRNKNDMAFIEIEDYTGRMELTIFKDDYTNYKEFFVKGKYVVLKIKKGDRGYCLMNPKNMKGKPIMLFESLLKLNDHK